MLCIKLFLKLLRGHTWGRSVFYQHLDICSICMNRPYTCCIFPTLRKNAFECTTETSALHKHTRSVSFLWQTLVSHTPKWQVSSCFQTPGSFPNTAYCISSNILVWMETCFHSAIWHASEVTAGLSAKGNLILNSRPNQICAWVLLNFFVHVTL